MNLVTYPNPILKKKMSPVTTFDKNLRREAFLMSQIMFKHKGLGLSAPQAGLNKRLIVLNAFELQDFSPRDPILVNPKLHGTFMDGATETDEEGCLSIPGIYALIERKSNICVKYKTVRGKESAMTANGLLARVIQHELDHLDGKLFIDHLSKLKLRLLMKKYNPKAIGEL